MEQRISMAISVVAVGRGLQTPTETREGLKTLAYEIYDEDGVHVEEQP